MLITSQCEWRIAMAKLDFYQNSPTQNSPSSTQNSPSSLRDHEKRMNERPAAPSPLLNEDITKMLHALPNVAESPESLACS